MTSMLMSVMYVLLQRRRYWSHALRERAEFQTDS